MVLDLKIGGFLSETVFFRYTNQLVHGTQTKPTNQTNQLVHGTRLKEDLKRL
jgi:hypothetical protein